MKKLILLALLTFFVFPLCGAGLIRVANKTPEEVRAQARREQTERSRKIVAAMRRGVQVMPMYVSPNDFINPGSKTDRTLPEELQAIPWAERLDCVLLHADQIIVARQNVATYSIMAMENVGRETIVTYSLPVHWDNQWHALNRYTVMTDPASGDRYFPRRVENKIPFDKVLIINGYNGRTINFKVVYPRIKDGVTKVVFSDERPIQTELPLNRTPDQIIVVANVQEMLQNSVHRGEDIF
ncbi:MAG: hypothetical protein RR858_01750 [Mucinivorans sp.]